MQTVSMRVKFTDDNEEQDVKAAIGDFVDSPDDDGIFYYFESEEEIKQFMVEGSGNDFVVLSYTIEE